MLLGTMIDTRGISHVYEPAIDVKRWSVTIFAMECMARNGGGSRCVIGLPHYQAQSGVLLSLGAGRPCPGGS